MKTLWLLDAQGQLVPRPVRVGLSDGKLTAVEPLRGESEVGDLVVTGVQSASSTATATPTRSPAGGSTRRMPMPPLF